MIVRGVCALKPGLAGVSETIAEPFSAQQFLLDWYRSESLAADDA